MCEVIYSLIYNDDKKKFILLGGYSHQEHEGYIKVFESITELEYEIFISYLESKRRKKLWTNLFIMRSAFDIRIFLKKLLDINITFEKN